MVEWRRLAEFPAYEISEDGQVRRAVRSKNWPAGKMRSIPTDKKGYARVSLDRVSGKRRFMLVHRLVCEAWHGPPPFDGAQAAHNDGCKTNNHFSNLRWCTNQENARDRVKHGTQISGEQHAAAKLTDDAVRFIRAAYSGARGEIAQFARRFGVGETAIRSAVVGRTWRGVK